MSESTSHTAGRKRSRLLSMTAVLAAVVVVMGATPAMAAPSESITAAVLGTVTQSSESTYELAGVGASSRLGGFTYAGHVQIIDVDSEANVVTDVLIETLRMPNGDTVTIRCDQVATPGDGGVLVGSDTWTVIGGTGRYQNATGSGTGTTYADLAAGSFTKVLTGVISR